MSGGLTRSDRSHGCPPGSAPPCPPTNGPPSSLTATATPTRSFYTGRGNEGSAVGVATAKRYVLAYRDGGLDRLKIRAPGHRPASDLAAHADVIQASLTDRPVRTTAEAVDRIAELAGLRRGLTQTRTFLAGLGFTWQRTRAVPVPPKSR